MLGSFSYQADSFKLTGKDHLCACHWSSPSSEFELQLMTFPAKQLKTNQLSLCVKLQRFGSIWSRLQPKTTHRHPFIFLANFTSTINIFSSGRLVFPLLKWQRVMPAVWPSPRAKLQRPRGGWTLYSPVSSSRSRFDIFLRKRTNEGLRMSPCRCWVNPFYLSAARKRVRGNRHIGWVSAALPWFSSARLAVT